MAQKKSIGVKAVINRQKEAIGDLLTFRLADSPFITYLQGTGRIYLLSRGKEFLFVPHITWFLNASVIVLSPSLAPI